MPGSCTQDGNPCAQDSNCCTRLCLDLGSGVKVCQPASGCRMTGDYCDKTQACCGGSPDALHPADNPYGVFCDTTGRDTNPPRNDSSTKDDFRCTNGTSCNPPGNICGGSGAVNASQNCCDGKKAVCKPDSNGVYRCFGGCPGDNCGACPTGYDANDPACCIQPGTGAANVCQFRDQCCNGAPCVPGVDSVLRCTAPPPSCKAMGATCLGETDTDCCSPNSCLYDDVAASFKCGVDTTACRADGDPLGCTTGADCCSKLCTGSPLECVSCLSNGTACTTNGQCCSSTCDLTSGTCVAPCQAPSGLCTADSDCCSGTVCVRDSPSAPSGTCGAPACAGESGACNGAMPCCDGTCVDGEFIVCTGLVSGCTCSPL
jgi:hypothetical protein